MDRIEYYNYMKQKLEDYNERINYVYQELSILEREIMLAMVNLDFAGYKVE